MIPSPPSFLRFTAVALYASASIAVSAERVSTRQRYNLPSGDASVTLSTFAKTSGKDIVYMIVKVKGKLTNAVVGEYSPKEALDKMLEGTALLATQDAVTGAFIISLVPTEGKGEVKPKDKKTPTPMSRSRPSLTTLLALIAAAGSSLEAQDRPKSPDETIVLNPFVVSSEKENGYAATSTLAGTRLNTPIKDLGASISIYTKDFLTDLGATNSNELMIFATGMEAGGAFGNYSGSGADMNAAVVTTAQPRNSPETTRARGIGTPNRTRGFFGTGIAMDAYNTETVTIARGPNAILFGVGNPAGTVDVTLIRPDLLENSNKVETRYGNNDSLRGSLDLNRVIVPGKLGVRVAALHDEERFNQRPAFEKKRRQYGALTYEPFKKTAIRLWYERGDTRANRPLTILPINSISSAWLSGGRPGYDFRNYDDPAINPNAANVTPVAGDLPLYYPATSSPFTQIAVVYPNASLGESSFAYRTAVLGATTSIANRPLAGVYQPDLNRDLSLDTYYHLVTTNIAEFPANYWVGNRVPPGQQPGVIPANLKFQGFTDFSMFDFKNQQIDETGRQGDDFDNINLAIEQRAWQDRVGIELAFNRERITRYNRNSFESGQAIAVDVSRTLLGNNTLNPNYGRPFAFYRSTPWNFSISENESQRATGFVRYDFQDLNRTWGRFLGKHTLTGVMERGQNDSVGYSTRLAVSGPGSFSLDGNISQPDRYAAAYVYLGPSLIGNTNPVSLSPIRVPIGPGPVQSLARSFRRSSDPSDVGTMVDLPVSWVEIHNGGTGSREVIKSKAAVFQSNWLDDHLVTILGWRRDEDYFSRTTSAYTANPADPLDPGKVHYGLNDFSFQSTPPLNVAQETKTYSAVLKWPRSLVELPAGSDVSIFYNRSGNFTPVGGRVDPFGNALKPPQGRTKEFGFNFSALNDRIGVRVNWFETRLIGQSSNPSAAYWAIIAASLAYPSYWLQEGNVNPGNTTLVAQRKADAQMIFDALPSNFRSLYEWRETGTAPNLAISHTQGLPGATDTIDLVAKGTEIDIVINPTRNWRILANVARQETVQSNMYPFFRSFLERMGPVWDKLAERPILNLPAGSNWQVGDPLPAGTLLFKTRIEGNVRVPFATAVASEGAASAEQREWRANLVTNYTFGPGSIFGSRLRGWHVGGAVRWQDKLGLGYPSTRAADGVVKIDIQNPYYAPAETNVDAWVGYTKRFYQDRIEWKVQLNVRNLIADDSPIGIAVQPWGETAVARLAPEKRWYLTNTFSF